VGGRLILLSAIALYKPPLPGIPCRCAAYCRSPAPATGSGRTSYRGCRCYQGRLVLALTDKDCYRVSILVYLKNIKMKLSRKDWLKIASPLILLTGVFLVNYFAKQKYKAEKAAFKQSVISGVIDSVYIDEEKDHKAMALLRTGKGLSAFPLSDFISYPYIPSVIGIGDTLYKPAGKMELWILGTSGDKSKYNFIEE
jgi:hypothetical protein